MIHFEPRWGRGRREAFPISPEDLKAIKEGNPKTDRIYAKKLGYRVQSITNIRNGHKRQDG